MKNFFLCVLTLLLLLSCGKNEMVTPENASANVCGVVNPVEDLPWLKAKIEENTEFTDYCPLWQVIQGEYVDKTVYILINNSSC
jgi:hypothetical protein